MPLYQYHALESSIGSVPAVLLAVQLSLPRSGQEVVWVPGRGPFGRSTLDLLDHDRLGQPREHAALHDVWLS